ncbi:MAG: serine hydrolase, partial [Hyphomicrobiaceae bacterium]
MAQGSRTVETTAGITGRHVSVANAPYRNEKRQDILNIPYKFKSPCFGILFSLALILGTPASPSRADPDLTEVLSPPAQNDGWQVGSAATGFDKAAMTELAKALARDDYSNVHAVLVEHGGKLVFEQYLSGTDSHWGRPVGRVQFDRETLHDVRSITKSVTSLLLGIALKDDFAGALDKPVVAYLPESNRNLGPRKSKITL